LSINGVNDVRQRETHKAETLVSELTAFEVELAIEKIITNNQELIKSQQN
jgi:hypothetical protein